MDQEGRRGPSGRRKPKEIDAHVGSRVRLRRKMLGLSQSDLAAATGLSFQQVQKYEHGANRIGASRLLEFARILDVPVAFFFDDTDPVRAPAPIASARWDDPLAGFEADELVTAYYAIESPEVRERLLGLLASLSAANGVGAHRRRGRPRRASAAPPPAQPESVSAGLAWKRRAAGKPHRG